MKGMKSSRALTGIAVAAVLSACDASAPPAPAPAPTASAAVSTPPVEPASFAGALVHERVILSPVYDVDRIYKSMKGPQSTKELALGEPGEPELLWIVGFEAVMVEPDGKGEVSQEFMCHTNLDMDATQHQELFGDTDKRISGRLFTLSQGQYRIELPRGFGIPILSAELVSLNTQVLNLNMKDGQRQVRHRVIVRFVRDAEVKEDMKALYPAGVYGLQLLEGKDGHFGVDQKKAHDAEDPHAECLPGRAASPADFEDGKGRKFTGHWIVKPGREENHTRVTEILELPWDTTLHYVAVHLHPFAESMVLRDLTTGQPVWKAFTRQADVGIGLAHVDFMSSSDGIALHKDHEYEVVSVYDNTSGEDQDSMAVMNLYVRDKEFRRPDLAKANAKLAEPKKREPRSDGEGRAREHRKAM